jgi:hypothetical protein
MGALSGRLRRLLAALLLALPGLTAAQAERELQIKAAFLYKFGDFVEWPAEAFAGPDGAFVIGVVGAEAMADELEKVVTGRTVQERVVVVRRLKRGEPLSRLHVLFVGQAEAARLPELAAAAQGQPVLLVSDSENATTRGSMINFVSVDGKVRFDVALPGAERGRLKISARLLAVARRVSS